MTYQMVQWSPKLDLSDFYQEAAERGFLNNSCQERMIDTFRKEKEWNAWILYDDDKPIGSVVAHSFDDVMGPNTYRILTRVCSFGKALPTRGLVTAKKGIVEHQSFNDQFLLPACLEWAKGRVFATSNDSEVASQRLVHKYYFPILEKKGISKRVKEVYYRNTKQTVWEIFPDNFWDSLSQYPRWS